MDKFKLLDELQTKTRKLIEQGNFADAEPYRLQAQSLMQELYTTKKITGLMANRKKVRHAVVDGDGKVKHTWIFQNNN